MAGNGDYPVDILLVNCIGRYNGVVAHRSALRCCTPRGLVERTGVRQRVAWEAVVVGGERWGREAVGAG